MILLSFDIEAFDVPLEHDVPFAIDEQMEVSIEGANRILDILRDKQVRATMFTTANFAERAPEVMRRMVAEGHEVGCHSYNHWTYEEGDLGRARQRLREITGQEVAGFRMPRMAPVSDEEIERLGFRFNSSLNPCFIPGRYMHLTTPRTHFMKGAVHQVPASVTPLLRLPLFWLSAHNFPQWLYHALCRRTWRHDGYFTTYFHPWEFYPLGDHPELRMPYIIRHNAGEGMCRRLAALIDMFRAEGAQFLTYSEFLTSKIPSS
mgnify:FL=1